MKQRTHARTFLADMGMGFTGLALGAMLAPRRRRPRRRPPRLVAARRQAALRARRPRASSGCSWSAASATWRASTPSRRSTSTPARRSPRRRYKAALDSPLPARRTCASSSPTTHNGRSRKLYPAAGRLPEARPERHRGQRLVAAPRRLRRRHRRRPLDVDDRQRPRRPAPVPHRPARPRRAVPDHRLVGPLRPGLAERQPAAVRRPRHAARRLLRRHGRPRRQLPRPRARRRPARRRPEEPAAVRRARRRRLPRGAGGRVRAARPAEPARRPSSTPTTRPCGPGSSRTSWPSACRRPCPRCCDFDDETPDDAAALRPRQTRRPRPFGEQCLAARRLVERGVRFVQIYHGGNGGAGAWDAHGGLQGRTTRRLCGQVDQPIAGLLKDLKRRGLLDETLVVWAHRVRPHARRAGRRRPRPPPLRLLGLAGRRRHQGRRRPRRDRRARLPRRRGPPLRHRHPRHRPAPARPRPAPARSPRPQAAGDRLRQADPRDPGVTTTVVARENEERSPGCEESQFLVRVGNTRSLIFDT